MSANDALLFHCAQPFSERTAHLIRDALSQGADANHRSSEGDFPLLLVRDARLAALLIHEGGANARAVNPARKCDTVFARALHEGNEQLVRLLLSEKLFSANELVRKRRALQIAVAGGHVGLVGALIAHGADTNAHSEGSMSPVLLSVYLHFNQVLRVLIAAGAHVDTCSNNSHTQHQSQSQYQSQSQLQSQPQLQYQSQLQSQSQSQSQHQLQSQSHLQSQSQQHQLQQHYCSIGTLLSPLHVAVKVNNCEAVELLIEAGAKPRANVLRVACKLGHLSIVKYLVEQCGMDINENPRNEQFPLLSAVAGNQLSVVRYLLDRGANVHLVSYPSGSNALDRAALLGHLELMQELMLHHNAHFCEVNLTLFPHMLHSSVLDFLATVRRIKVDVELLGRTIEITCWRLELFRASLAKHLHRTMLPSEATLEFWETKQKQFVQLQRLEQLPILCKLRIVQPSFFLRYHSSMTVSRTAATTTFFDVQILCIGRNGCSSSDDGVLE